MSEAMVPGSQEGSNDPITIERILIRVDALFLKKVAEALA
jgi:hypothetical protein